MNREQVKAAVYKVIGELVKDQELTEEMEFKRLAIDSIDIAVAIIDIENELNVRFSDDAQSMVTLETIGELIDKMCEELSI